LHLEPNVGNLGQRCLQDPHGFGHDFLSDAVAGEDGDLKGLGGRGRHQVAGAGSLMGTIL
jgi:hypothetical protein